MIQDIQPSILKNEWKPEAQITPESPVFRFAADRMCVMPDMTIPRYKDFEPGFPYVFLFELDGKDCFLARSGNVEIPKDAKFMTLREIRATGKLSRAEAFAAYTAYHLYCWYSNSDFCGCCGCGTTESVKERARICPECGNVIYPRINPSVIVGVLNHDHSKIVLTKYAHRDFTHFALVAGFTEIGETLERTVEREVMEEIGLAVTNIRYYKSQPWGTAGNILAGFFCEAEGSEEIRRDEGELASAGWYAPSEVELQPDDFSLTNEMMSLFKNSRERLEEYL